MTRYRLDWIAQRFGLELRGDGQHEIGAVASLSEATTDQIAFFGNPRYAAQLRACQAGAVIVHPTHAPHTRGNALLAADPYVAYAKVASLFDDHAAARPGIHPSASVDAGAQISAHARIGPFCVIEAGAIIATGADIGAHGYVGPDCQIGAQARLLPRVTLVAQVRLGKRTLIHSGAVLGADGWGLARDDEHWIKVPQLGGVRLGDDCEIGANSCIDRGAIDDTVLGCDVRVDNQVHIAHNVVIGAHTAIAGCAAVAGSARIGAWCEIGGGAGILGHLSIADRVRITAMSLVTHSITRAGEYSSGTPLQDNRRWRRNAVRFKHLDELARRMAKLEKDQTHE